MQTVFRVLGAACFMCYFGYTACTDCAEPVSQEWLFSSGAVYIGCHPGPYYLSRDSLKVHCGAEGPFDFTTRVDSIVTDCTYDELAGELGAGSPEITLTRSAQGPNFDWEVHIPDADVQAIILKLGGQTFEEGEYPFLSAREIETEESVFRLYAVNRYIGGCFHDILIWELQEKVE